MSSLRERRRKRTADTICRAAIDLAVEHGLDNVTTEMISEAAGISPRTFFNYFPYKEAVYVPPPLEFEPGFVEGFLNSDTPLLEDIITIFMSQLDDFDTDREYMLKLHKLSFEHPKLLNLRMAAFHEYEMHFAELLKVRLNCANESPLPMQIAAVSMATIRVGFENWIEYGEGSPAENVSAHLRNLPELFNDL